MDTKVVMECKNSYYDCEYKYDVSLAYRSSGSNTGYSGSNSGNSGSNTGYSGSNGGNTPSSNNSGECSEATFYSVSSSMRQCFEYIATNDISARDQCHVALCQRMVDDLDNYSGDFPGCQWAGRPLGAVLEELRYTWKIQCAKAEDVIMIVVLIVVGVIALLVLIICCCCQACCACVVPSCCRRSTPVSKGPASPVISVNVQKTNGTP